MGIVVMVMVKIMTLLTIRLKQQPVPVSAGQVSFRCQPVDNDDEINGITVVVVVYCLKYKVHSCWKQRRFYHNLSLNMSKPPLYDGPNVDEARYVAQTVSEMVPV